MMTKKSGFSFPKVLRIDGLEIPLSLPRRRLDGRAAETLKNQANAQDVQETDSEHGHVFAIATLLNDALDTMSETYKEGQHHDRIVTMLTAIKDTDVSSPNGQRRINIGLNTTEGQSILKQFKVTPNCTELDRLEEHLSFDWSTQQLTLTDVSLEWMFPEPTTHFELGLGIITIDFEAFSATLSPLSYYMFIREMEANVYELAPKKALPLNGIAVAVISSRRYELKNNVLHEMCMDGASCMKVVGVHLRD